MVVQRLRRLTIIEPTLSERLVFAGAWMCVPGDWRALRDPKSFNENTIPP